MLAKNDCVRFVGNSPVGGIKANRIFQKSVKKCMTQSPQLGDGSDPPDSLSSPATYKIMHIGTFNKTFHQIIFCELHKKVGFNFDNIPALTVKASTNCSFHDDVPISSDALARCTNLSTVLCEYKRKGHTHTKRKISTLSTFFSFSFVELNGIYLELFTLFDTKLCSIYVADSWSAHQSDFVSLRQVFRCFGLSFSYGIRQLVICMLNRRQIKGRKIKTQNTIRFLKNALDYNGNNRVYRQGFFR